MLPDGWNARSAVHEYGGGAWWVDAGVLWFVRWDDQRLYRLDPGAAEPVAVTPEPEVSRATGMPMATCPPPRAPWCASASAMWPAAGRRT